MVDTQTVRQQLDKIGARVSLICSAEVAELPKILVETEEIQHFVVGQYSGGFAVMVATNLRLLLVDKKLLFLNVEDIRYDMIAELDYGHQFIGATIHIRSFSKDLKFQSFHKALLREFTNFVQQKVMQMRQQFSEQEQTEDARIPIQTFNEPDTRLTGAQAQSIIPLSPEDWYRANPRQQSPNPYAQSPLMTRRRIGPFSALSK